MDRIEISITLLGVLLLIELVMNIRLYYKHQALVKYIEEAELGFILFGKWSEPHTLRVIKDLPDDLKEQRKRINRLHRHLGVEEHIIPGQVELRTKGGPEKPDRMVG